MIGESGRPAERSVVRGLSITEVVVVIVCVVVIERSGVMGVVAVVEEFSSLIIHFFWRRSRWRREARRYNLSPGQNLHQLGTLRGRRPRVSGLIVGMVGGSVEIENFGTRDQSVLLCCTCDTFAHGRGTENLLAHVPQSRSLCKPLWRRSSSMMRRESVFEIDHLVSIGSPDQNVVSGKADRYDGRYSGHGK